MCSVCFTWCVQVADFGLSKEEVFDGRKSGLKGTYGYMDPDYMSTNKFTKKSDVYSFGIILFELITAINPQQGLMEYIDLVSDFRYPYKNFCQEDSLDWLLCMHLFCLVNFALLSFLRMVNLPCIKDQSVSTNINISCTSPFRQQLEGKERWTGMRYSTRTSLAGAFQKRQGSSPMSPTGASTGAQGSGHGFQRSPRPYQG